MKIVVLNGSPKGNESVTGQYVQYIEKSFPQHEFIYLNVAQTLHQLEQKPESFEQVMEVVQNSDGVIWSFPLYVFLVHANYKRFIELIWERGCQDVFKDKYTALIASSIHFFDNTALNYMHAICDDLQMKYIDFFSVDMDDLMKEEVRKNLIFFAERLFNSIDQKAATLRAYSPIQNNIKAYIPGEPAPATDLKEQKVVIVTDSVDQGKNIGRMVERFKQLTGAEVIDISSIDIKGGCLGCIRCGFDNECIYTGKDDIEKVYAAIKSYDVIVFAGAVRDRYLSARWKLFIDRRFFNTHQPMFNGRQVGYLISGPMGQLHNLREILQANSELDETNLGGILTDEYETSEELDERLKVFAESLIDASVKGYIKPRTFLGIGGTKIFRDKIWGELRFVFQGDHRYYKKHGIYDFPQKDYLSRMVSLLMTLLTKIPPVKRDIQKNMKKHMIQSHQKILEKM